jgi:probable addiction module antidote protein
MNLRDFNEEFADQLRDPEFVSAYLSECLSFGEPDVFLRALREVVKAQSGMAAVAKQAEVNRESLYKALDEGGNPTLRTLQPVLRSVGYRLAVVPDTPSDYEAAEDQVVGAAA